jgi:hypothetical protein
VTCGAAEGARRGAWGIGPERSTDARAPPRWRGVRAKEMNERRETMAKKIKLKPAKSGSKPKPGTLQDGLVKPLEDSYHGTKKMIGGIRGAKNKMPKAIRDVFPDF